MEINLLNALMLQLNTIIWPLALFKLIIYSNLFKKHFILHSTALDILNKKLKNIKSRPTDPISNHKATRNKHIFYLAWVWP